MTAARRASGGDSHGRHAWHRPRHRARARGATAGILALGGMRPAADVVAVAGELRDAGADVDLRRGRCRQCRGSDRGSSRPSQAHFGRLNALVNNAGRAPRVRADLLEATEDSFEEVLRTNLQGPYFLTQRVAPLLVRGSAQAPDEPVAIVFVTSVSATMVSPNRGEYCVSKAGLAMAANAVCRAAGARRRAGLRSSAWHHRHRHDGIGEATSTTSRIADGLIPCGPLGHARRRGTRRRVSFARRPAVCHRLGDSRGWRARDSTAVSAGLVALATSAEHVACLMEIAVRVLSPLALVRCAHCFCRMAPPEPGRRRASDARGPLHDARPRPLPRGLVQKEMYPGVAPRVDVYAPLGSGPHRAPRAHRRVQPAHRERRPPGSSEIHTGPDFFERMLREKPGNVVVISGRNSGKIDRIAALGRTQD